MKRLAPRAPDQGPARRRDTTRPGRRSTTGTSAWVAAAAATLAACVRIGVPGGPAVPSGCGPSIQALEAREEFGIGHPDQIVAFELPPALVARVSCVGGPDGAPVPFQLVDGGRRLLVRTDLPAGARRRFTLHGDAPPATPSGELRIVGRRDHYEIAGPWMGVRIPRFPGDLGRLPAPIQGVRLPDGAWTAADRDGLRDGAGRPRRAVRAGVRFLERGPLRVVAEIAYDFGQGSGSHRTRVELQAGQPSLLLEEDSDADVTYGLDLGPGLAPDQARYRGHHASSPRTGREPGGGVYRPAHERPPGDALVELADLAGAPPAGPGSEPGALAVWDPWIVDGGWTWLLYRRDAPPDAPVLGLFSGRASRALGATASGARVRVRPGSLDGPPDVRVEYRARPPGALAPRVRVAWGIYVGRRGDALVPAPGGRSLAQQKNLHAGIDLTKVLRWQGDPATPAADRPGLYLAAERMARLQARVRADPALAADLLRREPWIRPLLEAWRDPSGRARQRLLDGLATLARDLLAAMVHGDGVQDFGWHYWHGGLALVRAAPVIEALRADPGPSPGERSRVEAIAALFGGFLWDDDFVPLFDGHGLHLGTENMPAQQRAYRGLYALLLADQPPMRVRAAGVAEEVRGLLRATIAADGAHVSSTNYIGASLGPILGLAQALKLRGTDLFRDEPRLARFAEFYLNLLTPPEARFGGRRKLVSIGDGSTVSSELFGQLATGLADVDPGLAARLMGAWRESGAPHSPFHGSSVLKIDPDLPTAAPAPASASFPGWYSALRAGVGTPEETVLWLVHGDTYRDHYHDDQGSIVAYALGAPLSLDWGSFYSPRVAGGFLHSGAQLEARLGRRWDADSPPLDAGHRWEAPAREAFVAFTRSAYARASFRAGEVRWRRAVHLIERGPGRPLIVIRDRFEAPAGSPAAIVSLNLAAEGPVGTPAGPAAPPARTSGERPELPSAGHPFALPPGPSRLSFRGRWGTDWDLWAVPAGPARALLGSWGHGWHPAREQAEFLEAVGRPFEERQHVLRVRTEGALDIVILPRRRGDPAAGMPPGDVRAEPDGLAVVEGQETLRLDEDGFTVERPGASVLVTLGARPRAGAGLRAAGGPLEIAVEGDRAVVTAHGPAGARRFELAGRWRGDARLARRAGEWILHYPGGGPVRLELVRAGGPSGAGSAEAELEDER